MLLVEGTQAEYASYRVTTDGAAEGCALGTVVGWNVGCAALAIIKMTESQPAMMPYMPRCLMNFAAQF